MDVLGTLPVWAQLLIAFLVAGVLIVMNVGWLIQARGWLEQQKQRRAGNAPGAGTTPARTSAQSDRDRV
jgi:hypothetical protein